MLLQNFNEKVLKSIICPSSIRKAIELWDKNEHLFIGEIIKDQQAHRKLCNYLAGEFINFNDLLSTSGNMTKEKLTRVAVAFLESDDVKHLAVPELKYFLSEAFSMRYGKVYHGFGLDVLLDWFEKYWAEREIEFENLRIEQHSQNTAHEKGRRSAPFKLQSVSGKATSDDLADYKTVGEILNNLKDKK